MLAAAVTSAANVCASRRTRRTSGISWDVLCCYSPNVGYRATSSGYSAARSSAPIVEASASAQLTRVSRPDLAPENVHRRGRLDPHTAQCNAPSLHCCARIALADGVGGRFRRHRGGAHRLDAESVAVEMGPGTVVVVDRSAASAATVVVVDATGASTATVVVSAIGHAPETE